MHKADYRIMGNIHKCSKCGEQFNLEPYNERLRSLEHSEYVLDKENSQLEGMLDALRPELDQLRILANDLAYWLNNALVLIDHNDRDISHVNKVLDRARELGVWGDK